MSKRTRSPTICVRYCNIWSQPVIFCNHFLVHLCPADWVSIPTGNYFGRSTVTVGPIAWRLNDSSISPLGWSSSHTHCWQFGGVKSQGKWTCGSNLSLPSALCSHGSDHTCWKRLFKNFTKLFLPEHSRVTSPQKNCWSSNPLNLSVINLWDRQALNLLVKLRPYDLIAFFVCYSVTLSQGSLLRCVHKTLSYV